MSAQASTHTLRVHDKPVDYLSLSFLTWEIDAGNQHWFAHTQKREHADLIVRAVNNHDALIALLKECLACEFPVTDRAVIKKAEEVIARAEGR